MNNLSTEIIAQLSIIITISLFCGYIIYSIFDLRRERKNNQSLAIK